MAEINQIIGGAFAGIDGTSAVAGGYMTATLSQDATVNGNTLVASGVEIKIPLDANGNVVTSPAQYLWPNDVLSPSGTFYTIAAYTAKGQLAWGPNAQQVLSSPSPFNIGVWVPASINTGAGSTAGNDVTSVFGRTGAIFAQVGDYSAFYAPLGSGGVSSVFGRSGTVTAAGGDYTAAQVTNAADVTAANTFSQEQTFNGGLNATFGAFSEYITAPNLVNSFNGRSGTVVPVAGDYNVSQVTGAAPLASPTLTGVPAAPTAASGTNTTQLATTAFVQTAVSGGSPFQSLTTTGSSGAATLTDGVLNIPEYSGGGGEVSSVFGRTGAVTAATGDYTAAQVTNAAATNAANTFTAAQTVALPTDNTYNYPFAAYDSALASGSRISFLLGQSSSANNAGNFGFVYSGSGSTSNALIFGLYGNSNHNLYLMGNGNNGVNNASPAYALDVNGTINSNGTIQGVTGSFTTVNAALNGTLGATTPSTIKATTATFSGVLTANSTVAAVQTTAATSTANQNSPALTLTGNYWNGSASAADTWTIQNVMPASGITPYVSQLEITHSGASGGGTVNIGNLNVANLTSPTVNVYGSPTSYVFGLSATNAATSGANYSSPFSTISGSYWNSSASVTDTWAWQNVLGTGSNPTSTLTLSKEASTSGTSSVSFGSYPVSVGTLTAGALTASSLRGSNTATVAAGAAAGSGATVAFSSGYNGTATAGCVQITTGRSPSAGTLFTIAWTGALPSNPNALISPDSAASAALLPFFQSSTPTSLTFGVANAPTADTLFGFSYMAIG